MSLPPTCYLEEIEAPKGSGTGKRTWQFRPSWSSGVVTVQDTGDDECDQLVRWYLNEHAAKEPINSSKARKAEAELRRFSRTLSDAIRLPTGSGSTVVDIVARNPESTCHSIPWELLEEPALAAGRRVVVRRRTKAQGQQPPQQQASVSNIFRIAIIAARGNQQDQDYQQAALPLLRVLDDLPDGAPRVQVDVIRPSTYKGLEGYLEGATSRNQTPNLVHFDLHGGLQTTERSTKAVARLYFANRTPKSAKVVAELLRTYGVKLAVLNACESARGDSGLDANLAQTFSQTGISAVLAMSYRLNASAVAMLVQNFYTGFLNKGLPFAEAACEARRVLRQQSYRKGRYGMEVKLQDWMVPVVYSATDGDILASAIDRIVSVGADRKLLTSKSDELPGRDIDVLELETTLTESELTGRSRLIFLDGPLGIGKTSLLRHVAWWWAATGMVTDAVYFDMAGHQNQGPEKVCRAILKQLGCETPQGGKRSQQRLCEVLTGDVDSTTKTPGVLVPKRLLLLDHFFSPRWPFPKDQLGTDDPIWTQWKSLFTALSKSPAYTIVASYRWPFEFAPSSDHVYTLRPRNIHLADALQHLGCRSNANALLVNWQDQEHLDVILKWCESYPPLLPILGPLVDAIGVAGVSEALTKGLDLFSYRQVSHHAVEKFPPYEKASQFWKGIPSSTRKLLICLAPFYNCLPRMVEVYFRLFAEDDLERSFSRLDFIGKYAADSAATKAAGVKKALPVRLEIASRNTLFIKVLNGIGLIRGEVPVGAAAGGGGTVIYSMHPVFSLFLRRQARKAGYVLKPGASKPTKRSLCLEKSFVDYHEQRVVEWIAQHGRSAFDWDYSHEMQYGLENFKTAMELKLSRPVGTFELESMPAFLWWCYKTTGESFRAASPISPKYLARSAERALPQAKTVLSRSLARPYGYGARLDWAGEVTQLYAWLEMHYLLIEPDRQKADKLITDSDKAIVSYNEAREMMRSLGLAIDGHDDLQTLLSQLKDVRDGHPPGSLAGLSAFPIPGGSAADSASPGMGDAWDMVQRAVSIQDRFSKLSESGMDLGYWDLQTRVADIDALCADYDNVLLDLAPRWPKLVASLDSEMLMVIRSLGFEMEDDGVDTIDLDIDKVSKMDIILHQPPNYASKVMKALREGEGKGQADLSAAKEGYQKIWDKWLRNQSHAHERAMFEHYGKLDMPILRSNVVSASLQYRSLLGDWESANALLDNLLLNERHRRFGELSADDAAAVAGWYYQKAVCAYHLGVWRSSEEHLSFVLASSGDGVPPRLMFQSLLQMLLLFSSRPARDSGWSTSLPSSQAQTIHHALLVGYTATVGAGPVYARNGALLALLLQSESTTETIAIIEHTLSVSDELDITEHFQAVKRLGEANGNFALARRYLLRVKAATSSAAGTAKARDVLATAEGHLFTHKGHCGCEDFLSEGYESVEERLPSGDDLVRWKGWPRFDLEAAAEVVTRPQLLSIGSLAMVSLQNKLRGGLGGNSRGNGDGEEEDDREDQVRRYLGSWHGDLSA
ncbi:CHAT domain-containing protein [Lasiosphaeria hispida]|uniref:CHAT domain-containing protein n=1 Tax=Lasiosphaeria hispida TaxID=260671 RepID=A0AAJ0HL32_9PEZI|nr:CHAT domain-containing protein [Lasiosphaeria hispida]